MIRYKIVVEYDGSRFCGWQFQNSQKTIQGTLQNVLEKIVGAFCLVEGCGRTDAGVHAKGQVAHFDLPRFFDTYKLVEAMNTYLRFEGVAVVQAEQVDSPFHARFSCIGRAYEYLILNRQAPSPLLLNGAWHVRQPLNVQAMQMAAHHFLGTHDFSAFRSAHCQAQTPQKTLSHFSVNQDGAIIRLHVASRSFLHNQVRIMVGTLKLVGQGKIAPQHIASLLESKNRTLSGPTAPAHGLYFLKARYADSDFPFF